MSTPTHKVLTRQALRQAGAIDELAKVIATEQERADILAFLEASAVADIHDFAIPAIIWWDTLIGRLETSPQSLAALIDKVAARFPSNWIFSGLLQEKPRGFLHIQVAPGMAPEREREMLARMEAAVKAREAKMLVEHQPTQDASAVPHAGAGAASILSFAEHGLTWLHVSDIHFGDSRKLPDFAKQNVLSELLIDAKKMAVTLGPPDFIFVTGDIAFHADIEKEYPKAIEWLQKLAASVGTPPSHVLFVPGNHDVNRSQAVDGFTPRVIHEALREVPAYFDEVFSDRKAMDIIWAKYAAFSVFANRWGTSAITPKEPFWIMRLKQYDRPIILVGLNTCINSFNDRDGVANLAIGQYQLQKAIRTQPRDAILIVLMHHPPEWLLDGTDFTKAVSKHAHIVLCGHIHREAGTQTNAFDGTELLRFDAGAAHANGNHGNYGYTWGRITTQGLTYYPRTWVEDSDVFTGNRNKYKTMDEDGAVARAVTKLPQLLSDWMKGTPL